MDQIDVPRLDSNASLSDAIAAMHAKGRSGVLVEHPSGPRILDIDIVLYTLRTEGNVKCSELTPRVAALRLESEMPASAVLSDEDATLDVVTRMDRDRAAYVLARIVNDDAEILARHEYYGHILGTPPTLWRCRDNPTDHIWTTDQLWQGTKCRVDMSPVDPF